jgi:hypothetical protein
MRQHFRILEIALLFCTIQNKFEKKYSCLMIDNDNECNIFNSVVLWHGQCHMEKKDMHGKNRMDWTDGIGIASKDMF